MSEEIKPEKPTEPTEEPQDEMESFDEMERNFHKVVQELVTDNSLDDFRKEYENLHQALVTSHEHNSLLIDKCRSLNNEILANANKVSSVMTLSQNDQRTIAGLRHEFEKAWKLVEVSQEKENKSKEVVDSLKQEISNLSRLVEQGGAVAFTQESSLQEITDAVQQLKKEIVVQAIQLETMTKDVSESQTTSVSTKEIVEKLNTEFAELTTALENERNNNKSVAAETEITHCDITKVKSEYSEMQKIMNSNHESIKGRKRTNDELNSNLKEDNRNIKSATEDKKMNLQMVQTAQKVLEDKIRFNGKVQDDINSYDDKFKFKEQRKTKLLEDLKTANNECEKNKQILAEVKQHQKEVNDEKEKVRARLSECRQEVYLLSAEHFSKVSRVQAARRELEKNRTEVHSISSKKGSEKAETKFIESQNHILVNEMLGMKEISHDQRRKIVQTNEEIETYQIRGSGARSNRIQVIEEVKIREETLDERNIFLSKLYYHIKKQDNMLETIQNERDLSCRQLEVATADNASLRDENKALVMGIRALKEDIREKDKLCLETHMKAKKIIISLSVMNKEIISTKDRIKVLDETITEHRNKIQRAIYLISQAELDSMKQKQVVTDLSFSAIGLNTAETKRTKEIELLKYKVDTVKGLLSMGNMAYRQQADKLKTLKEELMFEVKRQTELVGRGDHRRALQLEQIRIQKSLLQVSGKCRALEDELEKPINVHRWRFLEGTNPELSQLLRMTHELRDRLTMKISVLQRMKDAEKKIQERANVIETHLTRSYNGNIQEEFRFLTDILRQKSQQLRSIQDKVYGQQTEVIEQKDQVMTMRNMVREEKTEYFESKKKVDLIRASTSMDKRPSKQQNSSQQEPKYIGGGFAVGGVVRNDSPDKNTPISPAARFLGAKSALASPHIVQPKSASTITKKVQKGWMNPQRGPMKPFLPTVTQGT